MGIKLKTDNSLRKKWIGVTVRKERLSQACLMLVVLQETLWYKKTSLPSHQNHFKIFFLRQSNQNPKHIHTGFDYSETEKSFKRK